MNAPLLVIQPIRIVFRIQSQFGTTYSATIPAQPEGALVTYRIVAYDPLGNEAISPPDDYEVQDVTTTPTEPTTTEPTPTEPGPGPGDAETMLMVYGAFGALVVIVLALGARRRK